MAYLPHLAPAGERRKRAAARLDARIRETAARAFPVPDSEQEDAINEALRYVRPAAE